MEHPSTHRGFHTVVKKKTQKENNEGLGEGSHCGQCITPTGPSQRKIVAKTPQTLIGVRLASYTLCTSANICPPHSLRELSRSVLHTLGDGGGDRGGNMMLNVHRNQKAY